MNSTDIQNREIVALQVIRALDAGVKIVDSIARGDGEWKKRVTPADEAMKELRAFTAKCKEEYEKNGKQ